jgi:hypothetical protein
MPAVAWGVDAASAVSVATLRQQGASFLCCYLAPYPSQGWKMRTPAEWQNYLANGFKLVANWESDGLPGNGFNDGADAARTSQSYLNDRKCPDAVVYFTAADQDPSSLNLGTVADYIRGAVSVLGYDRVGAYGGYGAIKYLADNNVCKYYWQTYAWSNGQWDDRAQLRQWKNTQTLDFDQAWNEDFGQYPRVTASAPATAPTAAPVTESQQQEIDDIHIQLCQSWNHPGPPAGPGHGWPVEMIADTHYRVNDLQNTVGQIPPIYSAIQQSYAAIQSTLSGLQTDIAKIKTALKIDTPPSA